jgi:hypothetical protein
MDSTQMPNISKLLVKNTFAVNNPDWQIPTSPSYGPSHEHASCAWMRRTRVRVPPRTQKYALNPVFCRHSDTPVGHSDPGGVPVAQGGTARHHAALVAYTTVLCCGSRAPRSRSGVS